uniref:Transposase n=1 Tax=Rhizobium meliloti TaxID=382 RepID=Q8GNH8_RHIML|nr:unknown [Sinorhizobium meliloti]
MRSMSAARRKRWLDAHRDLLNFVTSDRRRQGSRDRPAGFAVGGGAALCSSQSVPPVELRGVAFHLQDSASFRAFARLPWGWSPKKSVLHKTISAIRADTWEAVNRMLLASARQERLESGKVVRVDSTVTAALIHEPSDSSLCGTACG